VFAAGILLCLILPCSILPPLLLLVVLLCRHGVSVLDSYHTSLQLHEGHVTVPQSIAGIIDCLHFCRPSLGEVRPQQGHWHAEAADLCYLHRWNGGHTPSRYLMLVSPTLLIAAYAAD
jgi:hypothetical protein